VDSDGLARRRLLGILSGSWLAQACYAAVKLGLPDQLAAGPRTAADLAAATGAHARTLARLLRALASAGVLRHCGAGRFGLTPVGQLLRTGAPGSAVQTALMQGEEVFRSFAEIMHTVRTGEPAFEKVYGQPFYAYLDEHPAAARTFHDAMGGQPVPAVLSTCDLSGARSVVDVGGGDGALLARLLTDHPGMRGALVERPDALRQAGSRLSAAGLAQRVELLEGSFFDPLPAGRDIYVLARILHNWADARARHILDRVHEAMPPGGRLLVLEELLPAEPDPAAGGGLVDLLMLVTLEGYDRTEDEYRQLLSEAGFEVRAARPGTGRGACGVLEAARVSPPSR
jgi:hypothetical protein